ncbi:unnamed protein product, partial [Effrenium voratum]
RSDCALPEQSFSYSCKMAPLRSVFLLTSLAASVSALREEMREPVEDVACCAMFSEGEDTNVAPGRRREAEKVVASPVQGAMTTIFRGFFFMGC